MFVGFLTSNFGFDRGLLCIIHIFVMFYVDQSAQLVCLETMAVKNLVFGENCSGSEVDSLKITFFTFLTQTGPKFWPLRPKYGIP